MKQISLTLSDNEFDKFMGLLKSFKSAKNIESKQIEEDNEGLFGLTDDHKKILDERRVKHLSGESKSYTLEEVKARARASRNQ